ncbi:KH domain-containing protein [Candidatus Parcubacteria bacterium]|nr:KH domain-containing protein [Candidatus Parcubacteria bacterium]
MIKQENLEIIKKTAEEFFKKICFEPEIIEVKSLPNEETVSIDLEMEEPQILIGERGQTLAEIQHLLKAMLRRKIAEQFYINVDINDYKKKKSEYLKEMARSVADEVALSKKERVLGPMPAYERRIIHLELAERENIVAESIGQEPERRVVIKPADKPIN